MEPLGKALGRESFDCTEGLNIMISVSSQPLDSIQRSRKAYQAGSY